MVVIDRKKFPGANQRQQDQAQLSRRLNKMVVTLPKVRVEADDHEEPIKDKDV